MRERGRLVPRWQYGRVMRCGQLQVSEAPNPVLRRIVRRARLLLQGKDLLPPLRDARLIAVRGDTMTLTGCEAIAAQTDPDEVSATLFQQSWMLIAIDEGQAQAWFRRQCQDGRIDAK